MPGPSPYISVSERINGARGFEGRLYWIDLLEAANSSEYISHENLLDDLQALAKEHPEFEVRVRTYIDNAAPIEGEFGCRALQVVAIGVTVHDLASASSKSIKSRSGRPIAAEAIRQTGAWGMSFVGMKAGCAAGAAVGIETGPGAVATCVVGSLVGGWLGYKGADAIADQIDEN